MHQRKMKIGTKQLIIAINKHLCFVIVEGLQLVFIPIVAENLLLTFIDTLKIYTTIKGVKNDVSSNV